MKWKTSYHILKEHYHTINGDDKPDNIILETHISYLIEYEINY